MPPTQVVSCTVAHSENGRAFLSPCGLDSSLRCQTTHGHQDGCESVEFVLQAKMNLNVGKESSKAKVNFIKENIKNDS